MRTGPVTVHAGKEDDRAGLSIAGYRLKAVVFDFGGVLAEEGFRDALEVLARRNGHPPGGFVEAGLDALYGSGYLTGHAPEAEFWRALRRSYAIAESDGEARALVLDGFGLRRPVLDLVRRVRRTGRRCILLTDQTDWLECLDRKSDFLREFHHVYCSFRIGKSKRNASLFDDLAAVLDLAPSRILFLDDNEDHLRRARGKGWNTFLFGEVQPSVREVDRILGDQGRLRRTSVFASKSYA